MTKHKDLRKLVDHLKVKLGVSCQVDVTYWSWSDNEGGGSETKYSLYICGESRYEFVTVKELKAKLISLIEDEEDEGVIL